MSTDTPGKPPSLVIKAAVVTESTCGLSAKEKLPKWSTVWL